MNRRTARACAMKLVYEWDMGGEGGETTELGLLEITSDEPEYSFMTGITKGVAEHASEIDSRILNYLSEAWTLDRLSKVDTAILRVAAYEMMFTTTEPKFIINEAVELAKQYSDEKSPAFINGLLGSMVRGTADA